jgi:probable rRNA maturation factor
MAHAVAVSGAGPLPTRAVRDAARAVLAGERAPDGSTVSVTFLGPAAMRRLNREYKGHDRPTDVIAFALPQPGGSVAGDIYVCRYQAAREARQRGIPLAEEIRRLVIHGTLHVLGQDHPDDASRERSAMWRLQERYLRASP